MDRERAPRSSDSGSFAYIKIFRLHAERLR
jgi:hypothetical protein